MTKLAIAGVELLFLAVAGVLWWTGSAPWWIIPVSVLIPPALVVVFVVGAFAVSQGRGENPFQ